MALKELERIEGVHGVKLKTSHKAIPRKILLFVQSHLRLLPYYRIRVNLSRVNFVER